MKPLFTAFSNYNRRANKIIGDFIENMTEEQFSTETVTYFPTVISNIIHVLESDLRWVHRLKEFSEPSVKEDAVELITKDRDRHSLFKKRNEILQLRYVLDGDIQRLVSSISDFSSDFDIPFGDRNLVLTAWKLILQWFNHQTHHRGQVSVLLDIRGIDNDYSLMLDKIDGEDNG